MNYKIAISIAALGFILVGCGQPAATPTSAPAAEATVVPATATAAPTSQPTTTPAPSPSSVPATQTPTSAVATASPLATAATPPAGRVTDTPAVASPVAANGDKVAELAQRSLVALPDVGPRNLSVRTIEEQEWSDSSLGCPDPAAIYLAVITPGYKITLSDGTTDYAIHTNSDGSLMVWCNDGKPITVAAAQ